MKDEKFNVIINVAGDAAKEMKSIGGALGNLAKPAILGGLAVATTATAGLGIALKEVVTAASEAEDVQTQLNAVLKSTGGVAGITAEEANALADSLSKVTRFDDEVILGAENILLTFTSISGEIFPAVTETALDMSQALGQDVQQSMIMLGKALQDPITGLGALKRVGVNVNEEMISMVKSIMGDNSALESLEKAANKASQALPGLESNLAVAEQKMREMTASGKASESALMAQQAKIDELKRKLQESSMVIEEFALAQKAAGGEVNEAEALMQAQKLILQELQTEFGGSARAAGETFGGKMDILNTQIGNVKEAIGSALLPVLTDLAAQLVEFVESDEFQEWIEEAARWLREEFPKAVESTRQWIQEDLKPVLDDLVPLIRDELLPAFESISNFMKVTAPPAFKLFLEGWQAQIEILNFVQATAENTLISLKNLIHLIKGEPLEQFRVSGIVSNAVGGWQQSSPPVAAGIPSSGLGTSVTVNLNAPIMGFEDQSDLASTLGPIVEGYLNGSPR